MVLRKSPSGNFKTKIIKKYSWRISTETVCRNRISVLINVRSHKVSLQPIKTNECVIFTYHPPLQPFILVYQKTVRGLTKPNIYILSTAHVPYSHTSTPSFLFESNRPMRTESKEVLLYSFVLSESNKTLIY